MQKKKEQSSEEFHSELSKAFNFTYGDLEANQAGFITHRQAQIVKKSMFGTNLGCLFLAFSAVALLLMLIYNTSLEKPLPFYAYFAVAAIIPLATILFGLAQWRILKTGLEKRIVESTICKKATNPSRRSSSYYLYNAAKYPHPFTKFALLTRQQFYVLTDEAYRVYHLPKSQEILSLEKVLSDAD